MIPSASVGAGQWEAQKEVKQVLKEGSPKASMLSNQTMLSFKTTGHRCFGETVICSQGKLRPVSAVGTARLGMSCFAKHGWFGGLSFVFS